MVSRYKYGLIGNHNNIHLQHPPRCPTNTQLLHLQNKNGSNNTNNSSQSNTEAAGRALKLGRSVRGRLGRLAGASGLGNICARTVLGVVGDGDVGSRRGMGHRSVWHGDLGQGNDLHLCACNLDILDRVLWLAGHIGSVHGLVRLGVRRAGWLGRCRVVGRVDVRLSSRVCRNVAGGVDRLRDGHRDRLVDVDAGRPVLGVLSLLSRLCARTADGLGDRGGDRSQTSGANVNVGC